MTEGPINFLSNQEIWTDLVCTSVAKFPKPSFCEAFVQQTFPIWKKQRLRKASTNNDRKYLDLHDDDVAVR